MGACGYVLSSSALNGLSSRGPRFLGHLLSTGRPQVWLPRSWARAELGHKAEFRPIRVKYPGYRGWLIVVQILDTTSSLQRQMVGELYTPYWIKPHHSMLKRRGHQPKKN
jgi:hypothetical protein